MSSIPVVVERHEDGYVAYPIGITGIVVAEADTEEEVLSELKSAIKFHVETFGDSVLPQQPPAKVSLRELPLAG